MSEQNNSASAQQTGASATDAPVDKGKGKAVENLEDVPMADDDEDSEEESAGEEAEADDGEEEDEGMEAIDMDNIVGRRTRGKNIDWAKAAEDAGPDEEEDDEDDDFEDPEDESMQG